MFDPEIREALTFDDLLLIPQMSEIHPQDVDLETRLTRDLVLRIPLISAAMDTVTESEMAIKLAQLGGIGVIHKNLDPKDQAAEVHRVKKFESGMVVNPITIKPSDTLGSARQIMTQHNISGLPVVDGNKCVGILTNRDLRFIQNKNDTVSSRMTTQLVTVKEGVTVEESKNLFREHRIEKLLVVNSSGELKGLVTIKDIEKTAKYPNAMKDSRGSLCVAAAVGTSAETEERIERLIEAGVDVLFVDTAHGHSKNVIDLVKQLKKTYKDTPMIAGNIATADAAEALISAGVDGIKVGVGPGSICTTRIVSGVGVPQMSAIFECAAIAQKKKIPIIADGGIKFSGDIVKALAGGASSVMVGSLLAGTDESPGDIILYQGRSYKEHRGMGSIEAMKRGSKDRYFQERQESSKLVPEGIVGRVPHRGSASAVVHQLVGGMKSGFGYCGAKTISDLQEKAKFQKITSSGLKESHVHDVIITKEAPNYQLG